MRSGRGALWLQIVGVIVLSGVVAAGACGRGTAAETDKGRVDVPAAIWPTGQAALAVFEIHRDPGGAGDAFPLSRETIEARLLGTRNVRKLYMDMRLYESKMSLEKTRDLILHGVRLTYLHESEHTVLVAVSLDVGDPRRSAQMLGCLVDEFINTVAEQMSIDAARNLQALSLRTQDIERKLDDATRNLRAFEASRLSLILDDPASLRARYQKAVADVDAAQHREAQAKAAMEQLQAKKEAEPGAVTDAQLAKAKGELDAAAKQREAVEKKRDAETEHAKEYVADVLTREGLVARVEEYRKIRADLLQRFEEARTLSETRLAIRVEVLQPAEAARPEPKPGAK